MYKIDREQNRIQALAARRFAELGVSERQHLQEWLVYSPQALGEELLIIQKEFDGFDDTRERLDLLALDKSGNLVVIENKLDDSGRDVVWQAIKYASYCSSLTKTQIVDIYKRYLERYAAAEDALENICDFLEVQDLDETLLNAGNTQRLMLVAANFRREVTSTALWLLSHGVSVQCFKVTPYALGEQLLLTFEQIIPTPEAKELMVSMSVKEAEERVTVVAQKERHVLRLAFWEQVLEALRDSPCDLYNNVSPSRDHWLSAGSGLSGTPYNLIFNKNEVRVELYPSPTNQKENKYIFERLLSQKEDIEADFGAPLVWEQLEGKKACRIKYAFKVSAHNRDTWPELTNWFLAYAPKLEATFEARLETIRQELRGPVLLQDLEIPS